MIYLFITNTQPFASVNQWNIVMFLSLDLHLADAFIQSDLQYIQVIHFLSVCVIILDIIAVSKHDSPNKTLLFSLTVLDTQTSNNNQFLFNWHSKK